MDAEELRAIQAPIKDRYKAAPEAAMITLKARGTLDDASISCKVETGRALAVAGLHPATGGSGLALCSGCMKKSVILILVLFQAAVFLGIPPVLARERKVCIRRGKPFKKIFH